MATATRRTTRNGGSKQKLDSIETMRVLDKYVLGTSKFVEIPVNDLYVDPKYQRDLNKAGLRRLVNNYDPNLLEPLTVNDRHGWQGYKGGRYALVDGQHRKALAKQIGLPTLTCRVVSVDKEHEADLFVRLNRQRLWLTPIQAYKAEFAAGNPAVREIDACISERGLKISGRKGAGDISCVQAMKRIYSTAGFIGLARVIDAAMLAWPEDDLERFNGNVLIALNMFVQKNPRVDYNRLSERLGTMTARHLQAKASQRWHAWKQLDKNGGVVDAIAEEITRLYRKRS